MSPRTNTVIAAWQGTAEQAAKLRDDPSTQPGIREMNGILALAIGMLTSEIERLADLAETRATRIRILQEDDQPAADELEALRAAQEVAERPLGWARADAWPELEAHAYSGLRAATSNYLEAIKSEAGR